VRIVRTRGLFRAIADRGALLRAARSLGAHGPVLAHTFEPHGDSVAVLAEDCRVVLHTWPEHALVTVDVYSGSPVDLSDLRTELGWEPLTEADPVRGASE